MSEKLTQQVVNLQIKFDELIELGILDTDEAERIQKRLDTYKKKKEKALSKIYHHIVGLEAYLNGRKTGKPQTIVKEEKAATSNQIMTLGAIIVFAVLLISNWLSIAFSTKYNWPKGWFISDEFLGFALAGVSINILLDLRKRVQEESWEDRQSGIYASYFLQATVYAALIYWFVSSIPSNKDGCIARNLDENCFQIRYIFPFAVTGFFIGLFLDKVEAAMITVGERFAKMLEVLFSGQFESPTPKEDQRKELKEKFSALQTEYSDLDKTKLDEAKKVSISTLFEEALLLIQGNQFQKAEEKLLQAGLAIANAK